jgi:parvulin-like peptidyl-prolyl isomerase
MPLLRTILREPLVHFLLIGWLLFVLYNLISAHQGGSERQVVLSSAMVNEIAQGFQATWQRPPSAEELQGLLQARVREDLLFREGLALGLEADDPVIRRRIAQKVDVLAEESALADAASDSQLEDYLQRNSARYARPAEIAFEQVLFDPNRHGENLQANLSAGLQRLQAGAAAEQIGDRTQLPARVAKTPADLLARDFGESFATALSELPVGSWAGPVPSGFGWHLVRLQSFTPGRPATLSDVRKTVERDWENERRLQARQAFYDQLADKYEVIIEPPSEAAR